MITRFLILFLIFFVVGTQTSFGLESTSFSRFQNSSTDRDSHIQSDIVSSVQQNIEQRVDRARRLLSDVGLSDPPLVKSLKNHHNRIQSQFSPSAIGIAEASPAPPLIPPVSTPSLSAQRDPFAPTSLMEQEAQRQGVGPVFIPSQVGSQKVPTLNLRGYVTGNGNQPVALLEVGGKQVFLVREGDTISLQKNGKNNVLKVKKITKLSALVEVGTLGQVIVVR